MPGHADHAADARPTRSAWLRILLPALLILVWLAGAGYGGPLFGKVSEVSSNDATTYLPDSADATEVQGLLDDFLGSESIPAIVVVTSDALLADADQASISEAIATSTGLEGSGGEPSPALLSEDGLAMQAFVPIDAEASVKDAVGALDRKSVV